MDIKSLVNNQERPGYNGACTVVYLMKKGYWWLLIQWSTLVPLLFHECIRDYTTHLTEFAGRGVKDICHIMSRL